MPTLLLVLLTSLLVVCTHAESLSGFGNRTPPAACVASAAPWMFEMATAIPVAASSGASDPVLHAVTYNVHSGMGQWRGLWRRRDTVERHLEGIAETLAASSSEPLDIVALNEVDFMARRSGGIDQARYLADALHRRTGVHYDVGYGQTRRRTLPGFQGGYGSAVLVRHPASAWRTCLYEDSDSCGIAAASADMPALRTHGWLLRLVRESRGVITFTLDFQGHPVDVVVTHLDAFALPEREAQAAHLLRRFVDPDRTTVVLGDINAVPTVMTQDRTFFRADRTHDILTSGALADARVLYSSRRGGDFRSWATYPATAPKWPLDAVLGSLDLVPLDVRVLDGVHSDHRALYVSYRLAHDPATLRLQRVQHDTIRQRQLARIFQCDVTGAGHVAKLHWLKTGTQFFDLAPAVETARAQQGL